MLDLKRLGRLKLSAKPRVQRLVAHFALRPNYFINGVKVRFEDYDKLPSEPVIIAMNHTDRYNYWPFQLTHWQQADRFTATWVKGKYYEGALLGLFLALNNNIPAVSRGYLIAGDYVRTMGERPSAVAQRQLRELIDRAAAVEAGAAEASPPGVIDAIPAPILEQPRDILGRPFDPSKESYAQAINALFRQMMKRFVELNAEAFAKGLDLIIFPQGTRSVRLIPGRIGLAQIALHFRKTVVPVGCNGCDLLYPGSSPFATGGEVVYRFGDPITYEASADLHIGEAFEPFTAEAEAKHRDRFQGYVELVMQRINGLLDERHQFGDEDASEVVPGNDRFF